jgi:sortase A
VLVVLGTLLLAEGIVTVAWQEPFTSFSAARSQDRLDGDLGAAEAREQRLSKARVARLRTDQRKIDAFMAERATAVNEKTPPGTALGRLKIDKIDLNLVMVQSTTDASLTKGPAHYTETVLPGRPGIMGIAGHRTTYSAPFRNINELKAGNEIVVTMPYGRFTYKVVGQKIVDAAFGGVFTAASFPGRQLPKKDAADGRQAGAGGEGDAAGDASLAGEAGLTGSADEGVRAAKPDAAGKGGDPPEALSSDFGGLALTACHPLYSAAQRIIVYARLDSTQPIGGTRRAATS